MGLTCQCFWFVQHVVEYNLVIDEGHHIFQFENYIIDCARSFDFHNQKR